MFSFFKPKSEKKLDCNRCQREKREIDREEERQRKHKEFCDQMACITAKVSESIATMATNLNHR